MLKLKDLGIRSKVLRRMLLVGIIGLLAVLQLQSIIDTISTNIIAIWVNRGLGSPSLDYMSRLKLLKQAAQIPKIARQTMSTQAEVEYKEYIIAAEYLKKDENYSRFTPSIQLLSNPNFIDGANGWIQYNSTWKYFAEGTLQNHDSVIFYNRQGEGHASISQILQLLPDRCYLFSIVSFAERQDDIPTFWLYWETNEMNERQGHSLIKGIGDQSWQRRIGVFCLAPASENERVQVVIAPVNMYGNVSVYLESTRLYLLQEQP